MGLTTFALAATALPAVAGPFGFEMGMTVKQVQALVKLEPGDSPGVFFARTAPKPHPAFQGYALVFSPKTGLAKVGGLGREITVTGAGLDLRNAFDALEKSLSAKYGASERLDELDPRSVWKGPSDWMEALGREERALEATWDGREGQLPDGIQVILLRAKALSSSAGVLMLAYEFRNFRELKHAEDQSL